MIIYVVVVALAVIDVVESLVFARVLKSMARQSGRREDLLINQICNLSGRPWQPAPAETYSFTPDEEPFDPDRFITNLDTVPDGELIPEE